RLYNSLDFVGKGKRKPNSGGRAADRLNTHDKTRNLSLKEITDTIFPVSIQFELRDKQTVMPLGDHATHWYSYIGEVIRGVPLYYPSWLKAAHEIPRLDRDQHGHPAALAKGVQYQQGCFQGPALEEMRRLEAMGTYTDDEINRLARGGKQRGHIASVGRFESGGASGSGNYGDEEEGADHQDDEDEDGDGDAYDVSLTTSHRGKESPATSLRGKPQIVAGKAVNAVEIYDLVDALHSCKQASGKFVSAHVLEMKAGHWKRNCPVYHEELRKNKDKAKHDAAASSKTRIQKLQREGLLESINDESFDKCESCISGKMTKKPFNNNIERATDLLGLIPIDVCEPLRHVSRKGASYFLTFTDDFSLYSYVYLHKHKLEDYTLESDVRILNMVPTKKVDKTPYEIWHGKAPNLSYLKVWGCKAYGNFLERDLISQKFSGRDNDLKDDHMDTLPFENTSEILVESESL
nr:retrotransposon protein, putative, Ty1-copia subclass [Tanacetum cinerariifolium]